MQLWDVYVHLRQGQTFITMHIHFFIFLATNSKLPSLFTSLSLSLSPFSTLCLTFPPLCIQIKAAVMCRKTHAHTHTHNPKPSNGKQKLINNGKGMSEWSWIKIKIKIWKFEKFPSLIVTIIIKNSVPIYRLMYIHSLPYYSLSNDISVCYMYLLLWLVCTLLVQLWVELCYAIKIL